MILHITTRPEWEAAQAAGAYEAPSLASEGFIHMSAPHQVARTANRRFRGTPGLVLLVVDPARLTSPLKVEIGEVETGETFPHVYGPIDLDAVDDVVEFPEGPDGFVLPAKIAENAGSSRGAG